MERGPRIFPEGETLVVRARRFRANDSLQGCLLHDNLFGIFGNNLDAPLFFFNLSCDAEQFSNVGEVRVPELFAIFSRDNDHEIRFCRIESDEGGSTLQTERVARGSYRAADGSRLTDMMPGLLGANLCECSQ